MRKEKKNEEPGRKRMVALREVQWHCLVWSVKPHHFPRSKLTHKRNLPNRAAGSSSVKRQDYVSWKNKLLFNYFLGPINNSELILAGKKITTGLAKIQGGYATRGPLNRGSFLAHLAKVRHRFGEIQMRWVEEHLACGKFDENSKSAKREFCFSETFLLNFEGLNGQI